MLLKKWCPYTCLTQGCHNLNLCCKKTHYLQSPIKQSRIKWVMPSCWKLKSSAVNKNWRVKPCFPHKDKIALVSSFVTRHCFSLITSLSDKLAYAVIIRTFSYFSSALSACIYHFRMFGCYLITDVKCADNTFSANTSREQRST